MIKRASRCMVLLTAVATLIPATAAQAAPLFTASQSLASTSNGIGLGLSMQMYGGKIPNLATAQQIAQSHTTISASPNQLNGFGAAMKAANPNLRIFLYQNGMYAGKSQGSLFPASWYMHTKDGAKVQSAGYGNYLMEPRSTQPYTANKITYNGWGEYVSHTCQAQLAAVGPGGADGCFVDMLGTAPLSASYNMGGVLPVDTNGQPFTGQTWYSEISGPIADKVERASNAPVLGNGIGCGRRYFQSSDVLLNFATAGDAEIWMRGPSASITTFPTDAAWRNETQMLADSSTNDRGINATVKTWTTATQPQIEQWRRFTLGSFLIGNGGHATFEFSAAQKQVAWSDDLPLYHLAIGTPTQSYPSVASYLVGGVYQRAFTNGKVLVNTGATPVTVALGGTYHTVDRTAVTSVVVPAHDSVILTVS